jgi:hypothetical protein
VPCINDDLFGISGKGDRLMFTKLLFFFRLVCLAKTKVQL